MRMSNGPAMLASFAANEYTQKVPVQVAHRKQDVWHSDVLDRHEGLEPEIGWHSVGQHVDGLVAGKGTYVSL